ncbi:MAG: glycosyltransferase [Methylotenera sp.]
MNSLTKPKGFFEISSAKVRPEISILMPIFEQSKYIKDSVLSVLKQNSIVPEIIISDDASSDDTFEIALNTVKEWLANNECVHRIWMRKGLRRLWRDHLPFLVDAASCEIVCQAHGDDMSVPDRARILLDIFCKFPGTSLVASEALTINEDNETLDEERPLGDEIKVSRIDYAHIVECCNPYLIGFSQAWRRDLLAPFKRLDRKFAAVAHDRILPFRAALVGKVYLIRSQLILRREHADAAHNLIFDEPETDGNFGWALSHISAKHAMRQDLEAYYSLKQISEQKFSELVHLIQKSIDADVNLLSETYRTQTIANRQIAWVDKDTLKELRMKRLTKP